MFPHVSPARDASENMKMDVYNLVDTLKRYELLGNIIFFGGYCYAMKFFRFQYVKTLVTNIYYGVPENLL